MMLSLPSLSLSAAVLLLLGGPAPSSADIAIVTYLGNDFILKDGCPLPECNERDRACIGRNRQTRIDFDECVATGDGELQGCVTDRLSNGNHLTVPVYANFCSGRCYEDPAELANLERCPFQGKRHNLSPELQARLVNV